MPPLLVASPSMRPSPAIASRPANKSSALALCKRLSSAEIQGNGPDCGNDGEPDTGMRPEPGVDSQDHDEADCLLGPEDQTGENQKHQRHLQGDRQKCRQQEDGQDFTYGRFSNEKAPSG